MAQFLLAPPFSRAAANRLKDMNVPAYKIGSGECNNDSLIKHIAGFGELHNTKYRHEYYRQCLKEAVKIIESAGIPYALLHTTN